MTQYSWRLKVLAGQKYNPDQPRVPSGNPDGGQWTSGGTGGEAPKEKFQIGEDKVSLEEFTEATGLDEDELERMFTLRDYETEVELQYYDGKPYVKVYWWDEDGKVVGTAERAYFEDEYDYEPVRECHNAYLKFADEFQDRDLARDLYAQQIAVLQEEGYDLITLHADVTIGRYAWAKQGFDYDQRAAERDPYMGKITDGYFATTVMSDWLEKKGYDSAEILPRWEFESAYEVATFDPGITIMGRDIYNKDVPDDMELTVGKAFMLDKEGHGDWMGYLWIGDYWG